MKNPVRKGTDIRREVRPNHPKKNLSRKDIVCITFENLTSTQFSGDDQQKSMDNVEEPNTHLANAIRYLMQHGHDPTNIVFYDENESPVKHTENSRFKNHECAEWTKYRTEIQNGVCFSFKKTGTCLKKGCNLIHFNPNAAYPDYSSESVARKAMPYSRENRSNVNKYEPFNRLFSRRAPGDNGRPTFSSGRGKKSSGPSGNNNKSKLSVLSMQVIADMVSTASSIM